MQFTALFEADDAVSPVIGVILMVAITVILAAVIGTFVLGLAPDGSNPPQAQFTFQETGTNQNVEVTHQSGSSVDVDTIEVVDSRTGTTYCTSQGGSDTEWPATDITAGDTCLVDGLTAGSEGTLRVTWTAPDGSDSATLAEYDYDFS